MQGSLPCRNVEEKMSVEEESAARRRQLEEAEERKGEQKMVERVAAVEETREAERNKRWGDDGVGEEE